MRWISFILFVAISSLSVLYLKDYGVLLAFIAIPLWTLGRFVERNQEQIAGLQYDHLQSEELDDE
jgi:type IV secretory pathway VirB3-like protein